MKKRIYLAMLAACLALTMTGCGESGKTGTDTAETQENTDGKTAEAGVSRLVSVDNVDKYITLGEYKGLILDNSLPPPWPQTCRCGSQSARGCRRPPGLFRRAGSL